MSSQRDSVIDVRGATKVYRGGVQALRGVDLRVERGEIFGLLGPNGAGKSTLVKILLTIVRATQIEGALLGRPIGHTPTLARVGYLPEHHRFPEHLTAAQVVEHFGALSGLSTSQSRPRARELLGTVGLGEWRDKPVRSFSKGMRQRLGIAQALVNDPELVILDEPTDGVDPVGRRDIRELLLAEKARGRTVLLNSHLLSELEMVCDRVAIMVQGTVSMHGTIAQLTRNSVRYEVRVGEGELDAGCADLAGIDHRVDAGVIVIPGDDPRAVQPVIDTLRRAGRTIVSVRPVRESLEDLFMRAVTDPGTGRTLAPGARSEHAGARS